MFEIQVDSTVMLLGFHLAVPIGKSCGYCADCR